MAGVLCLLAATGAPAALAEVGLPGSTQAPQPLSEAPVLQTAQQTTTESVTQTTAPVLQTAQQTPPLPAAAEAVTAGTESVVSPLVETLPTAGAVTEPLLNQALPTLEPVLESAAPVLGVLNEAGTSATDVGHVGLRATQPVVEVRAASTATDVPSIPAPLDETAFVAGVKEPALPVALPAPTVAEREELTATTRRGVDASAMDSGPFVFPALPSVPGAFADTTSNRGGAKASLPSMPAPFAPGEPPFGLASGSAAAGAGALVLLLAALAAALHLVAPGRGRRLRPRLASWPRPILHLSLERPG